MGGWWWPRGRSAWCRCVPLVPSWRGEEVGGKGKRGYGVWVCDPSARCDVCVGVRAPSARCDVCVRVLVKRPALRTSPAATVPTAVKLPALVRRLAQLHGSAALLGRKALLCPTLIRAVACCTWAKMLGSCSCAVLCCAERDAILCGSDGGVPRSPGLCAGGVWIALCAARPGAHW